MLDVTFTYNLLRKIQGFIRIQNLVPALYCLPAKLFSTLTGSEKIHVNKLLFDTFGSQQGVRAGWDVIRVFKFKGNDLKRFIWCTQIMDRNELRTAPPHYWLSAWAHFISTANGLPSSQRETYLNELWRMWRSSMNPQIYMHCCLLFTKAAKDKREQIVNQSQRSHRSQQQQQQQQQYFPMNFSQRVREAHQAGCTTRTYMSTQENSTAHRHNSRSLSRSCSRQSSCSRAVRKSVKGTPNIQRRSRNMPMETTSPLQASEHAHRWPHAEYEGEAQDYNSPPQARDNNSSHVYTNEMYDDDDDDEYDYEPHRVPQPHRGHPHNNEYDYDPHRKPNDNSGERY